MITSSVAEEAVLENGGRILGAVGFGIVFGFLLQKGGVGKNHILVGQLLLQDFTVIKVMLSASTRNADCPPADSTGDRPPD